MKDAPGGERFQIMTLLGLVSTTIFVTGADAWMWVGPLLVLHLLAGRPAINCLTMARVRLADIRRRDPDKVGASRGDDVVVRRVNASRV